MPISLQSLPRFYRLAFAVGLALCILGLRLLLIANYSVNIPHEDPLIKECDWIIAPLLEGKPWLDRFLLPHNEHRIYLTLGANLALTLLAGQWDGRAQAMLSAVLYAGIIIGLFLWSWNHLQGSARFVAMVGLGALSLNIVAWEDVVWGFQSAFYFFIGLSLLAIHGALCARAWSPRWWLSFLAGTAALVSLGSGLLWTLPVMIFAAVGLFWGPRDQRMRLLPSGIAAALIFLLGWRLAYFPPWQAAAHAHSPGEFLAYLIHCLAWPFRHPLVGAWWLLPSLILGARVVARRRIEQREVLVFAFFLWTSVQALGLAYSRGADGGYPASRYGDPLAIGLAVQVLILGILWEEFNPFFPRFRFAAAAWLASLIIGLGLQSRVVLREELPVYRARLNACAENLRTYLLTGDGDRFLEGPLPLPMSLKEMVRPAFDRPGMRAIMPSLMRPPRALSFPDNAALRDNLPPPLVFENEHDLRGHWGTYSNRGASSARYTSELCQPEGFRYWQMDLAGDVGVPGAELSLVSEATGQVIERAPTRTPPAGQWRRVHLRVPKEPFRLVVTTGGGGHWIGWTNPVEVSSLSYWTDYILKRAEWFVLAGLVGFISGAVLLCFELRKEKAQRVSVPTQPLSEFG